MATKPSETTDILLVGVNAGYIHSAFALRCLLANLGPLAARTALLETDAQESTPVQLVERLLARAPKAVGFSVYIWNVAFVTATLRLLRVVAPEVGIVLGGPQLVAGDTADAVRGLADAVVCGEAEGIAAGVFSAVLEGQRRLGVLAPEPPDLGTVALPYALYSDADLATRVVYVESTRGCPFDCEYCTSADSGGIRRFPLERLLPAFETLLARGARGFKFLDRSFNHGGEHALAVLDFFLSHWVEGLAIHFEFTPQPLSAPWRERLLRYPPGALHVEVGVQTWDPDVARRIRRPFDRATVDATLRFLIEEAQANVHADLIVGLPGDSRESLAAGFDHLVALRPAELQVGTLKRLPGTAIDRHVPEFGMRFAPDPPYEVLATDSIPFAEMRRLARFARCWDLLFNRKRFGRTAPLLWEDGASPFERVMAVADWLQSRYGRLHALAPKQIAAAVLALALPQRRASLQAALEHDARDAH
jgi:radical SAM superfamily enzyme YgiQ (UPF0313 family)